MAKRRDSSRETFWRRTLRRRAKSGMTISEFCASEDLTESAYHYWRREIQRRDAESPMPKSAPVEGTTLVPVQLLDDRTSAAPVEIVATSGYVVRVSEAATADHLRRVLQAVSELD